MIKKYKLFKESNVVDLNNEFLEFLDVLEECQSYYKDMDMNQFSNSYSRTAQYGRKDNSGRPFDPDEDYRLVSDFLKEKGWGDNRIENLFINLPGINERIYQDNKCTCAPIDYFLYQITDEYYPLQGYKWDTDEDDEDDLNENDVFIKFGYGWHKTKYGIVCIEQNFETIDKFFNYVMRSSMIKLTNAIIEEKVGDYGGEDNENENNRIKEKIKNCIMIIDKSHNELYIDTKDMKVICESSLQGSENEDNWRLNGAIQTQKQFDGDIINIIKGSLSLTARITSPGDIKILFK